MNVNIVPAAGPGQEVTSPPERKAEKSREIFPKNDKNTDNPLVNSLRSPREKLLPALEKLRKTAPIFDFRFHFLIHEETKRIMVQIIDQETGKILNEIPPEKILDLVARIQELVGLLVDEKR